MKAKDVVEFIKGNIEPLSTTPMYGKIYRVAATLNDGIQLPCVAIASTAYAVDFAIRRLEETRTSSDPFMGFRAIVKSFLTNGNRVNDYDLKELSISPFAIPPSKMKCIKGETSMSWTEFWAVMIDGKKFCFGTSFLTEFFDMPPGYSANDIAEIIPAVRGKRPEHERVYREKPFFTCYVDGL